MALHQVQSLEDIVQMFCDIYDLQNRFRDGALINQGEFALASHIEGDPKLRRQFHLSRSEYDQLTADEQKKKREKFCALQAPQLTKSKNKKLVVATDGLMSAPIHRFGGKKPSKGQRPTGSRVTVTKGGNKEHQRKKALKRKNPEDDDELNVLDCLQDLDLSDTDDDDDDDAQDEMSDDGDVIIEDETSNANAPNDKENVQDNQLGHSIFGNQLGKLQGIMNMVSADAVSKEPLMKDPQKKVSISNKEQTEGSTKQPTVNKEKNVPAPFIVPLVIQPGRYNAFCPNLSVVQFQNPDNKCWANAAMVMQRYTFKVTNTLDTKPLYDVNGMEQFPALYAYKFSQFVCDMAILNENYVVRSTEILLKTFLDEYFRGRDEARKELELPNKQNEPGKIQSMANAVVQY